MKDKELPVYAPREAILGALQRDAELAIRHDGLSFADAAQYVKESMEEFDEARRQADREAKEQATINQKDV